MAGIGAIGGGFVPPISRPQPQSPGTTGESFAGALGTKSGLGESVFSGSERDEVSETTADGSGIASDLTEEEQKEVQELKQRDQEVRQHEQAHVAAAGRYAKGGPQYEFTTGPDGRQYATGGHVNIDVSPASTPEATIQKAQVVRRAALAPAEPSAQDRAVAAEASQLETSARRELQQAQQEGARGDGGEGGSALEPPPAISRRDFSQYQPESAGGSGVSRLDVLG